MAPGLIVYLINTGISIYLVIISILILLMVPLLPLFISSTLILPFGSTGEIYYRQKNLAYHLLRRNILLIIKEPMFLLNTISSMLVPILLLVIMLFTGEFSIELLKSAQLQPYLLLIFSGILISPAVIANISATAITREGQSFWETRVLPISAVDNIRYRVQTTVIFNLLGSLLLFIISLFIFPLTFKIIIVAGVFCITITLFLSMIDILVNIYRPLLNWTNPTAAVKNNLNVMYSLLIRAVIAVFVYLIYKTLPVLFCNYEFTILFVSIAFLISFFIVRSCVYTRGAARFDRISI